jgi:hypothetical protein
MVGWLERLKSKPEGKLPDPGLARRRMQVAQIPCVALADVHVSACRLVADRNAMLDLLPKHGVVAEVGVASGDFSAEILSRTQPQTLVLIDAWDAARYESGLSAVTAKFADRLASGQVEISKGYSTDRLKLYPDSHFDWVYIDTDHSFRTTMSELELAAAKVRPDGFICGHDFSTGNVVKPVVYGVIQACAKFCVERGWRYKYLSLDTFGYFSFCLERLPA